MGSVWLNAGEGEVGQGTLLQDEQGERRRGRRTGYGGRKGEKDRRKQG